MKPGCYQERSKLLECTAVSSTAMRPRREVSQKELRKYKGGTVIQSVYSVSGDCHLPSWCGPLPWGKNFHYSHWLISTSQYRHCTEGKPPQAKDSGTMEANGDWQGAEASITSLKRCQGGEGSSASERLRCWRLSCFVPTYHTPLPIRSNSRDFMRKTYTRPITRVREKRCGVSSHLVFHHSRH